MKRRAWPSMSGLTLIELMVVVVILGILVAVGVPSYRSTTQRSYWRAGRDILQLIYAGERSYFFINGEYKDGLATTSQDADWREIFMDNPNMTDPAINRLRVEYTVACGVGGTDCKTFLATATRRSGPCDGKILTIDQGRTFGGNWTEDPSGCTP